MRQSLDTIGAFLGPLLAFSMMAASGNNFRFVFWLALAPGVIAVILLVLGVRERTQDNQFKSQALDWKILASVGKYRYILDTNIFYVFGSPLSR